MTQTRITLTALKVAEFLSEETLAFTATVCFDGAPIATAKNDGHGGSTFFTGYHRNPTFLAAYDAACLYAKSLPATVNSIDPTIVTESDLERVVDELAFNMHAEKKVRAQFKRDISARVVTLEGGAIYTTKRVHVRELPLVLKAVRAKIVALKVRGAKGSDAVILNDLPEDEAFRIFAEHIAPGFGFGGAR